MAQKLDPKHKEMYERVMKTPTKKPSPEPEPKPNPKPTETPTPPPAQKSPFLSSMPIQPSKSLGIKTFTFAGGKTKVNKEEKKDESKQEAHEPKAEGEKKKASGFLIAIVVIGFVALWGFFWAFILDFI